MRYKNNAMRFVASMLDKSGIICSPHISEYIRLECISYLIGGNRIFV